jgi:SAM-dependent methyltransferase
MKKRKHKSSRELGLEVAAICGKHFLKLDHLHYGYWTADLPVDIANLSEAQRRYTDFLISQVPDGVRTVLDVGCGTGQTAKRLTDMGRRVDCVSPCPALAERARSLLTEASRIFQCPYEQLDIQNKYDMILFSESFQYIRLDTAIEKSFTLLGPDGYLLIFDPFKTTTNGHTGVGGGHNLTKFYERIAAYPFKLLVDLDVTEQTAPNLDLLDETMNNVARPVLDKSLDFMTGRYPLIVKFLRWKYRKEIRKTYEKYFNGQRRSDVFKNLKTYRLFLYRKQDHLEHGSAR